MRTTLGVRTISSTEAKAQLNALLAEVQRTGSPVTITSHGRPVAILSPINRGPRTFGQLPRLTVGADFDEPLPESELAAWEGNPGARPSGMAARRGLTIATRDAHILGAALTPTLKV